MYIIMLFFKENFVFELQRLESSLSIYINRIYIGNESFIIYYNLLLVRIR